MSTHLTFEQITEQLRTESQVPPGDLANMRMFLAAEYGHTSSLLEAILTRKTDTWLLLRKDATSDKRADRLYDATDDGKLEMVYRLRLKSIEKLTSAIKTRLDTSQFEARNQY